MKPIDHLLARRAEAVDAHIEPSRIEFDLSRENADLVNLLAAASPQFISTFEVVRQGIPVLRSAAAQMEGHFYRLPAHNRSYCYALTESDAVFESAVLVFKGTEPLSADFATLLDWMLQAPLRRSSRVMADHFPLSEGKIPGALSLKEACREAEIALAVQKKHLRHYGALAKIPTPLFIHRISAEQTQARRVLLREKLSGSAFDRIEPLLENGLAVYVYHYPSAPVRANYWGASTTPKLTQHIQRTFSEETAIAGWISMLVRLLYLRYLPYSARNDGLGACMDLGNAALDGGFCDLDSILSFDESPDDEFFRAGIIQSLQHLLQTVQLLLGLSNPPDLYAGAEDFVVRQWVDHMIKAALVSEARPGLQMDGRILQMMSPRSILDLRSCTRRKKRVAWYAQFAQQAELKKRYL